MAIALFQPVCEKQIAFWLVHKVKKVLPTPNFLWLYKGKKV